MQTTLLFTCEHGGNQIPTIFRKKIPQESLALFDTHRGLDIGALALAKKLAEFANARLFYSETSRLLIDLNRSLESETLFSEFSKTFSPSEQKILLKEFYNPYRNSVAKFVQNALSAGRAVVHISVHSFTPVWKGQRRPTEIGVLFDPHTKIEAAFARQWQKNLKKESDFVIHSNRPYRGFGDGQTTELRSRFKNQPYCGIEIEINQKFFARQLTGTRRAFNTKNLAHLLWKTLLENQSS